MVINGSGKWTEWPQILDVQEYPDEESQKKAKEACYYEACLLNASSNYLGDEAELIFEEGEPGEGHTRCFFTGCVKIEFDFWPTHPKHVPYRNARNCWLQWLFITKIVVAPTNKEDPFVGTYFQCKIDAFPLDVKIWCKTITFSRVFADGTMKELHHLTI